MSGSARLEATEAATDLSGMDDAQIEGLARHLGWKPMDEGFKGKPENFRNAREFVETANRNPAVLWNNLTTLDKRYDKLERQQRDTQGKLDQAVELIGGMTEQFRTVQERAYAKARAELLAQREAAVESGDKQGFARADTELQDLEKTKPAAPKQAATAATTTQTVAPPPEEVQEWGRRNPWFYTDIALQKHANDLHVSFLNSRKDLSLSENLDLVERTIKAIYPDKFTTKPAPKAAPVEDDEDTSAPAGERSSGTPRQTNRVNKRDFANLPKESKAQFKRYQEMIARKEGFKPLTEAEWAANHWEQFPEE